MSITGGGSSEFNKTPFSLSLFQYSSFAFRVNGCVSGELPRLRWIDTFAVNCCICDELLHLWLITAVAVNGRKCGESPAAMVVVNLT